MEIKDFIKEALLQIVDGVTSANDELKSKGAYIPTRNVVGDYLNNGAKIQQIFETALI